ncbi:MAG: SAM-dependent methyltransferase [Bacillota bacterium]
MRKNRPSISAESLAFVRAMESRKAPGERVCFDPFAEHFTGGRFRVNKFYPQMWNALVARTRYIDDYLTSCIRDGIQQLVILGAGYDSRPYRFDFKGRVRVFEVDHPATQRAKLKRLREILGGLPDYVVFVPVDFREENLGKRLYESGYDNGLKTLFIWEGVVVYLPPEAVDVTLTFIAGNSPVGSSIIFDYVYACAVDGSCPAKETVRMRRSARMAEERWEFGIDKEQVEGFLTERGFCRVVNADSEVLEKTYFKGINGAREILPVFGIVRAEVRPRK